MTAVVLDPPRSIDDVATWFAALDANDLRLGLMGLGVVLVLAAVAGLLVMVVRAR